MIALILALALQSTPPQTHEIMPLAEGLRTHDALPLVRVEPTYPAEMAAEGRSARCRLRFTVTAQGETTEIDPYDCPEEFHASAVSAIERWQFAPAYRNGEPVSSPGLRADFLFQAGQPAPEGDR